jgi:hypothetical protein
VTATLLPVPRKLSIITFARDAEKAELEAFSNHRDSSNFLQWGQESQQHCQQNLSHSGSSGSHAKIVILSGINHKFAFVISSAELSAIGCEAQRFALNERPQ